MESRLESNPAALIALAVSEAFPEMTYGAVSSEDQVAATEAFLAFDQGVLAEAPYALEAYISAQRNAVQ